MIKAIEELEQKIDILEKEKKELEQKMNILERSKNSVNNELAHAVHILNKNILKNNKKMKNLTN